MGAILIAGALVFWGLWWSSREEETWLETSGRTLDCEMRMVHRNAETDLMKVTLTYEYSAMGMTLQNTWVGHWPKANSPNALPEQDVPLLQQAGYPLTILYNPDDPSKSRLHYVPAELPIVYMILATLLTAAALIFVFGTYPRLRSR